MPRLLPRLCLIWAGKPSLGGAALCILLPRPLLSGLDGLSETPSLPVTRGSGERQDRCHVVAGSGPRRTACLSSHQTWGSQKTGSSAVTHDRHVLPFVV